MEKNSSPATAVVDLPNSYKSNPTTNEDNNIYPPKMSVTEMNQRGEDFYDLFLASQMRESPQPQFDGMGYSKYNETNEQADISYMAPKLNKMDTRMTTGVTHEKDSTMLSMLQGFNFEGKVHVFDENDIELVDMSASLTAMVRKSREIEMYDEKRPIYYRNLLVQGTATVREKYLEQYIPKKIIPDQIDFTRLDKVEWVDAGLEKVYEGCTSSFVDGKKIFYQDIRVQDIRLQPGVFTVEYIPRERAKAIFGKLERWNSVPKNTTPFSVISLANASMYSDWTFSELDWRKVEVVEAFRKFQNRYQLYLNGVPMLPADFPLTAISPSGEYPIAKGDLDPMNLFAYSKSIPAKTKVDQAVFDEIVKVMLVKFRQSAFPPTGNNSDQVLSESIWTPGRITPNLRREDLSPLQENFGITQSDFSFYKLIQEQLDNKSVSKILEGQQIGGDVTLGQYMDMQKKQMLKLGGIIDAVINWEKQMMQLRVANIIANWTKPIDQRIDPARKSIVNNWRTVTVEDTFEDGQKGTRVINFTDNNYQGVRNSESVFDEEAQYQKEYGKDVRFTYINPILMKSLKFKFYYEIIPVDKNNDKLTQLMFINSITQAMQIFGPQSLNVEYLKKRYAQVMGEDFDKFFLNQSTMQQAPAIPNANPTGSPFQSSVMNAGGVNAAPGIQIPNS